uniref:Uncharacterized protein n=1 Tax=Globodera rostochiensis TaxID=31243 RepID=A0A914I5U4_GLORO
MATSARLPSPKSPSSLVLIAALLFNCCRCCPADVLSLQDNACAKKGAGLPTGFSLPKDDQLLMEPWALGTDDINQPIQSQIHALLSNVEESAEPLHFSIIIIERDQKTAHGTCSQFFNAHLLLPNNVNCSFGSEAEVKDDHQQNECADKGTKCMALPVNCSFPMGRTETLPNVRVFTIKMWARVDALSDSHCSWKAIIDGVRVLLSTGDSNDLEQACWETTDPICCSSWQLNLLFCLCPVVLVLTVVLMVACLYRGQRRTSNPPTTKTKDEEAATGSQPTSRAAQYGVEVPDSVLSQEETPTKAVPAEGGVTVPEPLDKDIFVTPSMTQPPKIQATASDPLYQTLGNLDKDIFVKPPMTQPPKTPATASDPFYQTLGNLDKDIFVTPSMTQPPKTQATASDPFYQTLGNLDKDIFVKPSMTQPTNAEEVPSNRAHESDVYAQ